MSRQEAKQSSSPGTGHRIDRNLKRRKGERDKNEGFHAPLQTKMADIVKDKVAFEIVERGYTFRATYLVEPKGDALIEIEKDGQIVKEVLWPAYKIYNIAAHASDIVDGLEEQSDSGLSIAGATGFGGNVYQPEAK